eukprot:Hpha_TRINITY_DN12240_c0_g1::TRINITY_DN12240_c0_g1_i1::g.16729::m.16729
MGRERAGLEIAVQEIDDAKSEAACKRQRAKLREAYAAEREKLKAVLKKKAPKVTKATKPAKVKPAKIPKVPKARPVKPLKTKAKLSKPTKTGLKGFSVAHLKTPAGFGFKPAPWPSHTFGSSPFPISGFGASVSAAPSPPGLVLSGRVPLFGEVPLRLVKVYEAGADAPPIIGRSILGGPPGPFWEGHAAGSSEEEGWMPFSPHCCGVIEKHYQEHLKNPFENVIRAFRDVQGSSRDKAPCQTLCFQSMRVAQPLQLLDKIRRKEG